MFYNGYKVGHFMSKINKQILIIALLLTILLFLPYLSNVMSYEHDTFFHLSRIEGLATAIKNLDFLPKIYPYKNVNFGYGSPMFYSDFFLIIPAIVYNISNSIVLSYKLLVFVLLFLTALFMGKTTQKFTNNKYIIILSMVLYSNATYHLTNIYVRSALGELFGYCLMPLIILAMYKLLYEDDKFYLLTIVITALILSHNLSFILACILILTIIITNYKRVGKKVLRELLFAVIWVIGMTSFFTFPMLEQFANLNLFCESTSPTLFISSTLKSFQYLMTRTNFYIFTNDFSSMVVNTGLLLLLLPLTKIFIIDKTKNNKEIFINKLMFLGYFFLFIQSSIINYQNIQILYSLQFVWRFMLLACVLLTIPAAYYTINLFKKYQNICFGIIIVLSIGVTSFLLYPAFGRTNVITTSTTYNQLIDGSIIDPFYSAFYVRVELAGADYLPVNTIDYQNYDYQIMDTNNNILSTDISIGYNTLSFNLDNPETTVILPKTYYKGYQVYNNNEKLTTYNDPNTSLVSFNTADTNGSYLLKYDNTKLQTTALILSIISWFLFIYEFKKNTKN
jgi:hypothetical protein